MGLGIAALIFVAGLVAVIAGASSRGTQLYAGLTGKQASISSNSYSLGNLFGAGGGLLGSLSSATAGGAYPQTAVAPLSATPPAALV